MKSVVSAVCSSMAPVQPANSPATNARFVSEPIDPSVHE
jgi:hypothetical protein